MLATESSARCKVSEHSSDDTTIAIWPGNPRNTSAARTIPATPPAHPRPKIGVRRTSGRIPSRLTIRASRLGVAIPVPVTKKK